MSKQSFYQRYDGLILGTISVLLVVGAWELIWDLGWISPLFFSGPSAVAKQFWESLLHGSLLSDLAYSGINFGLGFLISAIAGVGLGIVFGWYRWLRLLVNPYVVVLYSMPRIALVPLIIVWFGIYIKSKVIVVFLFAFFPILVNTIA